MTLELLTRYWALAIASVLGIGIGVFVLRRLYQASPRGRLHASLRALRQADARALRAGQRLDKATQRFRRLTARADTVKPRALSTADEAAQDARMLKKIADDQVLVAIKGVRDVILEEFTPKRQDELRNKYLERRL